MMGKFYTLSMNEKANLRKDLSSWRGQEFTDEQAGNFDIERVLGHACMINVIHGKKRNGDNKADITAITPPMKGLEIPPPTNELLFLDLEKFDDLVYEKLSDNIKKMIDSSYERNRQYAQDQIDTEHCNFNDDIPF